MNNQCVYALVLVCTLGAMWLFGEYGDRLHTYGGCLGGMKVDWKRGPQAPTVHTTPEQAVENVHVTLMQFAHSNL